MQSGAGIMSFLSRFFLSSLFFVFCGFFFFLLFRVIGA